MIPCVSLTETSVLNNMKERIKDMRVFGCRLNFWNHSISSANALAHAKGLKPQHHFLLYLSFFFFVSSAFKSDSVHLGLNFEYIEYWCNHSSSLSLHRVDDG